MSTPVLKSDRSIGELLGELTQDLSLLVRQEVRLAKVELGDKAKRVGSDAAKVAVAGAVAFFAAQAIIAAIILAIAEIDGVEPWAAALIVGAILGIVGFIMLRSALADLKKLDPVPRRTAESLRDDVQWAKEQVR